MTEIAPAIPSTRLGRRAVSMIHSIIVPEYPRHVTGIGLELVSHRHTGMAGSCASLPAPLGSAATSGFGFGSVAGAISASGANSMPSPAQPVWSLKNLNAVSRSQPCAAITRSIGV